MLNEVAFIQVVMKRASFQDHKNENTQKCSSGLDHPKFGFYQFQRFLFIVVIVTSILLKTTFSQISIHSQLLVKIL